MIVDERLVTYINSLDTGNTSILDQIEKEALDSYVPIIRKEMQQFLKLLLAMSYEATPGNFAQKEKGAAFNWCVAKKKGRPYLYDRAAEKQSAGDAGEKRKDNPPQDRPCGGFFVFA